MSELLLVIVLILAIVVLVQLAWILRLINQLNEAMRALEALERELGVLHIETSSLWPPSRGLFRKGGFVD